MGWVVDVVVIAALVAAGCGPVVGSDPQDTETAASWSEGAGDSGAEFGADTDAATGSDDEPLTHGVVSVRFASHPSPDIDPYGEIDSLWVEVAYLDCLAGLYADHPELRMDGEAGVTVFGGSGVGGEGWRDRLCVEVTGDTEVGCRVDAFDQDLDVQPPRLSVLYSLFGSIEGRRLRIGPLPTVDTSGCDADAPMVEVVRVIGQIGQIDLWDTQAIPGAVSPTVAVVDQVVPLEVSLDP
jgi:hypothetical protein